MQNIEEIEAYVSSLRTVKGDRPAGQNEKFKTRKALMLMSEILKESGHAEPDSTDKAEYRRRRSTNKTGTEQDLSRIDRYFLALQAERRTQQMTIEAEPMKAGREKKSVKLMLYLTPTMAADIRDWCNLKRINSVNNYITELIGADLQDKDKQESLKVFRELSDNA